jgi:DNA repair exonuclease SbcCD ATPase subunit
MLTENEELNNHEKFKELGALANSGTLTTSEWTELRGHLQTCQACSETCRQYLILASEGMPLLAARYSDQKERRSWDDASTWRKLRARVRAQEQQVAPEPAHELKVAGRLNLLRRIPTNLLARAVLAACLVGAVGLVAYRMGGRTHAEAKRTQASLEDRLQSLAAEKKEAVDKLNELLDTQAKKLFELQGKDSQKERELNKLQSALLALNERASKLSAANEATNQQLHIVSPQRDDLLSQLRDTEQAYHDIQAELANLRSERDNALLRSASLESRIAELDATVRNQARRLSDDEQFLTSDRDIRELMGARKLYIADVFDVDSRSRTRKPFGRVFYTQGKSLIFYAFDLDRQSDVTNASSFQAWGRKEIDQQKPLNLGILYMDSESNRRWVLRFDDPKRLAEIDALFVTVEPHGGSQEPTGKPFLYALLRKEVNHP